VIPAKLGLAFSLTIEALKKHKKGSFSDPVEDLNFQKALASHQIVVVNFRREGRKRFSFPGLEKHERAWRAA
jgi:hypothetical protein